MTQLAKTVMLRSAMDTVPSKGIQRMVKVGLSINALPSASVCLPYSRHEEIMKPPKMELV